MMRDILSNLKAACMRFVAQVGSTASFARECFLGIFRLPLETGEVFRQVDELGAKSLPVVGTTGLVTGLILAIQSRPVLARFGAESYVPAMVSISVVRELGPILTALMVAGRVGSGMSAELGSMRVTEQIEAIEVSGIDSFRFLVVTRVLACALILPLLLAGGIALPSPAQWVWPQAAVNGHISINLKEIAYKTKLWRLIQPLLFCVIIYGQEKSENFSDHLRGC